MSDELDYAEMLEIPVETVTVNRRERKKKEKTPELADQVVDRVNKRMEDAEDPAYAESTPIERESFFEEKRQRMQRKILIAEFAAVCGLCATIFFTNIFLSNSAINVFVRDLLSPSETVADTRVYSDFALASPVNDAVGAEITVSDTGVLSFSAECSVYSPASGTLVAVNGDAETGYTVEIRHSDSFSTIMSGLNTVYLSEGDEVRSNLPLGYTDGESEVRVMFYSEGALLDNCVVNEDGLAWN